MSRGRSYQRNKHVKNLARTPDGGLVAWVQGTERYATRVDVSDDGSLGSLCTCPYWGATCKHAVAVVLEYLECLKNKSEVPVVAEKDRRLKQLQESEDKTWDEEDYGEEDYGEDDFDEVEADEVEPRPARKRSTSRVSATPRPLRGYLEGLTKDQLVALLEELADSFPSVLKALQDRREVASGDIKKLVAGIRREIRELSAEPGWRNNWTGEGSIPDYSGVRDRLEALLESGHADQVVELGVELLDAGIRHVETSDDEGETAGQIIACMDIVFRALPHSSLLPAEQMLWAIEAQLKDSYDLCQGDRVFWEREFAADDWNAVAGHLQQRLKQHPAVSRGDDFTWAYRRDRLTDWLIHTLENAGRSDEVIPLCEREAKLTSSYTRLVGYLQEAGRFAEAENWIRAGIEATRQKWPGIAHQLRDALREIRTQSNDWAYVAAMRAEDFFQQPSLPALHELRKAAEHVKVWPVVKDVAVRYLETGEWPPARKHTAQGDSLPAWPLPETGLAVEPKATRAWLRFPLTDVLIDIAIDERKPDEVLRWYDRRSSQPPMWGRGAGGDDKVAAFIVDTYPDRAIAIWKQIAEAQIAQTSPRAYEVAAGYLRKVHRTLKQVGREKEWLPYLEQLRQAHARKRRLLEILDRLHGKRIIDG